MKRFYSIVLCILFTAACSLNDKPDTASLGLSVAPPLLLPVFSLVLIPMPMHSWILIRFGCRISF